MERQKSLQPRLRILLGQATALGPGKAELLEAIQETGSISAAARSMGMSYRRAWTLVDNMNTDFVEPVISTNAGGKGGGGASVTPLGEEVIRRYRTIEEKALDSVVDEINEFGVYLAEHARKSTD
jgi:molybdate transport system regulatory protein